MTTGGIFELWLLAIVDGATGAVTLSSHAAYGDALVRVWTTVNGGAPLPIGWQLTDDCVGGYAAGAGVEYVIQSSVVDVGDLQPLPESHAS